MPAGDSPQCSPQFTCAVGKQADRPWEGTPIDERRWLRLWLVRAPGHRRRAAHCCAQSRHTRVRAVPCRSSECVINRARELRARCTTLQTCCTMLQYVVLLRLAVSRARESRARCTRGSAGDAPPAHSGHCHVACFAATSPCCMFVVLARAMLHCHAPRCRLVVLPRAIFYCHVPCCTGRTFHVQNTRGPRINHAPTANDAKCDVAVRLQCARACLRALCVDRSVSRCGTEADSGCARACDERCGGGARATGRGQTLTWYCGA